MKVCVVIATFGDKGWHDLAWARAAPSAWPQTPLVAVYHEADGTIASARNGAVGAFRDAQEADWLCFLDADDELEPGYLEAMALRAEEASLLVPRVLFVEPDGREGSPIFPNRHLPLEDLNHCVIGTLVERRLFEHVGGFREWPAYEDWDLWLRCTRAGAKLVDVPDAIYRAHRNPVGRNEQARRVLTEAYTAIRADHMASEPSPLGGVAALGLPGYMTS